MKKRKDGAKDGRGKQDNPLYDARREVAGVANVARWARLAQSKQMAELFAVSKPNVSMLISKILKEKELDGSVVKSYFTTAADGKRYKVIYYALEMILAVGFRVRGVRGTQFRQWANAHLSEYLVKGFSMDDEVVEGLMGKRIMGSPRLGVGSGGS